MNATARRQTPTTAQRIRWARLVIGAALLEVALIALAVPLFALVDNPFVPGAEGGSGDFTTVYVSISVLCFVVGTLAGAWVARPLSSAFALHGLLTGVVATAIYLVICSIPPNTPAAVLAAYGPFWFFVANGLRIVGSVAGAAYQGRRR